MTPTEKLWQQLRQVETTLSDARQEHAAYFTGTMLLLSALGAFTAWILREPNSFNLALADIGQAVPAAMMLTAGSFLIIVTGLAQGTSWKNEWDIRKLDTYDAIKNPVPLWLVSVMLWVGGATQFLSQHPVKIQFLLFMLVPLSSGVGLISGALQNQLKKPKKRAVALVGALSVAAWVGSYTGAIIGLAAAMIATPAVESLGFYASAVAWSGLLYVTLHHVIQWPRTKLIALANKRKELVMKLVAKKALPASYEESL